jgi:hypothetical protein
MTSDEAEAEMRVWSRRIVDAYADHSRPPMDEETRAAYAGFIGQRLLRAIALGVPVSAWPSYVNPAFDAMERRWTYRGPRLAGVDYSAGTVKVMVAG